MCVCRFSIISNLLSIVTDSNVKCDHCRNEGFFFHSRDERSLSPDAHLAHMASILIVRTVRTTDPFFISFQEVKTHPYFTRALIKCRYINRTRCYWPFVCGFNAECSILILNVRSIFFIQCVRVFLQLVIISPFHSARQEKTDDFPWKLQFCTL